ncbi:MAG: hypothetical protein ACOCWB_08440 [Bacteroidota bacterium]
MKKYVFYFLSIFFLYACLEDTEHSLRIENETSHEIFVRLDDSIEYTIDAQGRTDYRPIEEGYHKISGDYGAGFTIGGNGVHKWSVVVQRDTVILVQKL